MFILCVMDWPYIIRFFLTKIARLIIYKEWTYLKSKWAVQHNNMLHLVVTVQYFGYAYLGSLRVHTQANYLLWQRIQERSLKKNKSRVIQSWTQFFILLSSKYILTSSVFSCLYSWPCHGKGKCFQHCASWSPVLARKVWVNIILLWDANVAGFSWGQKIISLSPILRKH